MFKRKRLREKYTIMVVPHSKERVTSLRFSLLSVYVVTAVLIVVILTGAGFTYAYRQMRQNMAELANLRQINSDQRAQIDQLATEANDIGVNLQKLEELDSQLRQIMKLAPKADSPKPEAEASAAIPVLPLSASSPSRTLIGRPQPVAAAVSRGRADDLTSLQAQLQYLQAEVIVIEDSLTELKDKAISHMDYLAAKPSGWPAAGRVTSGYGNRRAPIGRGTEFHSGIDIAAAYGTPLVATGKGIVIYASWQGGYGRTVMIDHGYGFKTMYGHASRLAVRVGQKVTRGQVVAYMGSSGRSTGSHVHYQVFVSGRVVNPRPYMD